MTSYLIVGDGAAGIAAARAIRQRDSQGTIAIVSDDPNPHYYRAALTNYLLGQLRDDQLWGVPAGFYQQHRIGRYYARAVRLDPRRARVLLDNGQELTYDRLLIASGATPNRLSIPGGAVHGILTLRTLQDARRIADLVPDVKQAVIIGGGTLGLEWVQGLGARGVSVTYVIRERQIWPRFLDEEASEIVIQHLRTAGVHVLMEDEVIAAVASPSSRGLAERLSGVRTRSGREIPCQLLGIAVGVSANVDFLRESGLSLDGGVWTDEQLRTNLENVLAAGDVAHIRRGETGEPIPPAGLWQPARKQGEIAGANLAGERLVYQPGALVHATHLYDVDFAAVGDSRTKPDDRVIVARPGPASYQRVLVRNGVVAGVLMIGNRRRILLFKRLIDHALDVSAIRDRLLDPHFDLGLWIERELPRQAARRAPSPMVSEVSLVVRRPRPAPRTIHSAALLVDGTPYPVAADGRTTIGRVPGCDIVLALDSISRRHAAIERREGGFTIQDLGSTNGTWVGVSRLERDVPRVLQPGDQIRLGRVYATFDLATAASSTPALTGGVVTGPQGSTVLSKEVTNFGRGQDNDVVIASQAASRLHAQIVRTDDGMFLYDLGSTNGTFVNARRLTDAHRLENGDQFEIAHQRFTYHASPREATPRPGASPAGWVLVDETTGKAYPLGEGETIVGREASPDVGIVLADALCSRRQAAVLAEAGGYVMRDLASRNGTRLNGVLLGGPARLSPGDVIGIGRVRLRFERGRAGGEAADGA
ncbi:MAG: FHA domain-containing protein [Dehalococcoidia bacterium]